MRKDVPANTSTATSLSLNISRLAFKSSAFPTCCYKVFSIDLAQPDLSVRLFADYSVERAAMDNKGTIYCLALRLLMVLNVDNDIHGQQLATVTAVECLTRAEDSIIRLFDM
jgi:hypothetical protein